MAVRRDAAIGIFGGSFDPIHNGHCAVAQAALEHFGLEKILFVPAGTPPHKAAVRVDARHRLAMLKLAIATNPSFAAGDIELRRPGMSYTIDTISFVKKRYPQNQLYFIIGSDNLKEIPSWHRYREILRAVTLGVTARPGSSLRLPNQLRHAKIRTFPSPAWAVSSSLVRNLLAQGQSCRYLVAAPVVDYIAKHGLYR